MFRGIRQARQKSTEREESEGKHFAFKASVCDTSFWGFFSSLIPLGTVSYEKWSD